MWICGIFNNLIFWSSSVTASGFYKFCKFIYKSFLVRGHSLITYAKKTKLLTLPPCEYAMEHFGTYPPSLPVHVYTKWLIVKKEKLSTLLSFTFILKARLEPYNTC